MLTGDHDDDLMVTGDQWESSAVLHHIPRILLLKNGRFEKVSRRTTASSGQMNFVNGNYCGGDSGMR